jgi:hypothetical protein
MTPSRGVNYLRFSAGPFRFLLQSQITIHNSLNLKTPHQLCGCKHCRKATLASAVDLRCAQPHFVGHHVVGKVPLLGWLAFLRRFLATPALAGRGVRSYFLPRFLPSSFLISLAKAHSYLGGLLTFVFSVA